MYRDITLCLVTPDWPFLGGEDEEVIEEEEVDRAELGPHVEDGRSLGHLPQLAFLLQVAVLGDDGQGLEGGGEIQSSEGRRWNCDDYQSMIGMYDD